MSTLLSAENLRRGSGDPRAIELPAPTAWPIVLAFGFTLLFAGLLTNESVSVLGAALSLASCVGWFREVFPHEREVMAEVVPEDASIATERQRVERIHIDEAITRAWLPLETYPTSGWCERRLGGQCGDGRAGVPLRPAEDGQHLVSDQSSCRRNLHAIRESGTRAVERIPRRPVCGGAD